MTENEAINYINGLDRFVWERDAVLNIAYKHFLDKDGNEIGRVIDCDNHEVPPIIEDFCVMDLLEIVAKRSPWSVASSSMQHGNFRKDVGSETLTQAVKEEIRKTLRYLYNKYGLTDKIEELEANSGGLSWANENSFDV